VIATKPQRTPLRIATTSHLVYFISLKPVMYFLRKKHVIPPAAGPKIVFIIALSAYPAFYLVERAKVLPALK
jgi:hypothetical protein